jgi:putative DNA primase/helicase
MTELNPRFAADAEWDKQRRENRNGNGDGGHLQSDEITDTRPPKFSDEALALRFSEKHGGTVHYVATWGRWYHWTGQCWESDTTMRTFDFARAICRVASSEIVDPKQTKLASSIASAKAVAAVVSLARADRRHAAVVEQWDSDPMKF